MPATVSLTRPAYTDSDTLASAAFNAVTVTGATVPDAAAGVAGVMPSTTTAAGLAMIAAADASAQRTLLGLASMALQAATAVAITGGNIDGTPIGGTTRAAGSFTTLAIGTNSGFGGTLGQFNGSNVVILNTAGQISIGTTNAAAADMGGSLGFTANTTSLAGYSMGNISARLIATGAGVYRSYMAFATTDAAGSVAERMRLTDTGLNSTAIGATTPSTGAFTTLSATGAITSQRNTITGNGTGGGTTTASLGLNEGGVRQWTWGAGYNTSGVLALINGSTGLSVLDVSTTGLAVNGANLGTNNMSFAVAFNGATNNGHGSYDTNASAGTDGAWSFYRNASQVGTITTTLTATAYNTSSDYRLKTNIRDLTGSGAIIDAIQPRLYDWKTGQKDTYGFVAQEVFAVFPQAVSQGDDNPDTITKQWALDYSKLVPVLTAELKSLRARVAQLEAA
jgi:hypothetical protein